MADSYTSRPTPPSDWSQAFSSLPLEAPPADAWSRVAMALPRGQPVRRRSTAGWAVAATLAVAAGGDWLVMSALREAPTVIAQQEAGPTVTRPTHDASTVMNPAPAPAPAAAQAAAPNGAQPNTEHVTPASAHAMAAAITSRNGTSPPLEVRTSSRTSARLVATAAGTTMPSTTTAQGHVASTVASNTTAPTATSSLDDLRAESARLEALVAYARDDKMQSAAAAMLTGDVDDRLHVIDAALSQAGLGDAERLDLWTRRVDALRELAGLEGTQRWLAAQGESYEDALARVD